MECELVEVAKPLRQGDIFAAHPGTATWDDPWARFGVVLSADCDIAQGKTGVGLVYAPIVNYHTFIAGIWLPDKAAKLLATLKNRVRSATEDQIQFEQITNWCSYGSDRAREELTRSLPSMTIAQGDEIFALVEVAPALLRLANGKAPRSQDEIKSQLRSYDQCLRRVRPMETTPAPKLLKEALRSLKDRLDVWLIFDLEGCDAEMKEPTDFGYVASLRHFKILAADRLDLPRDSWYKHSDHYYRICRLGDKYRFDLLQKFSNMFLRVGLPDHRPKWHETALDKCAASLSDWV